MSKELILIVDDEENIIELGRLYLENEGFRVEAAADGLAALEKFEALQPALIVLDLMLSKLDGWEVCKKIRATTRSERGDFVSISISDTGPGIPPEEMDRIFERFYQVDKSRKRGRGTGLGLAIIKEIVQAHSGMVNAESKSGQGTRFTVLLPLTEADARTLITPRRAG